MIGQTDSPTGRDNLLFDEEVRFVADEDHEVKKHSEPQIHEATHEY